MTSLNDTNQTPVPQAESAWPIRVPARDLRVGDVISVLGGKRDTITKLVPYVGNLEYLWAEDGGAKIADFASSPSMTIEPHTMEEVFYRLPEAGVSK